MLKMSMIRTGLPLLWSVVLCSTAVVVAVNRMNNNNNYYSRNARRANPTEMTDPTKQRFSYNKLWQHTQQHWIRRYGQAGWLTQLEQSVEDANAEIIAKAKTPGDMVNQRRLICLPLNDKFDPAMGNFSHGHVQYGDKMSLPSCFRDAIMINQAPVPYLFAVRRIDGITSPRVEYKTLTHDDDKDVDDGDVISEYRPCNINVNEAVGGPLDCRAPSCYVFLPLWMMRLLGLKPYDIVEVEQVMEGVPAGSLAKLRPHSKEFGQDITNPQSVLETEFRHYSSLTQGATIAMQYNGKVYWFDVEELRSAPRGEKVSMIKMQDSNVATDFLLSKDQVLERQRKRKQTNQQN